VKNFSYLSGTPFHSSASAGGSPFRVMFGQVAECSRFSSIHFAA
jgi:hypothetical protein